MTDLLQHQGRVIEAHARYAAAKRHLESLDQARETALSALLSARAELDALASREPEP